MSMIGIEQVAHDLAMVYINNRYGAQVTGEFQVGSTFDGDISGSGEVHTERLPDVDSERMVSIGTGEKYFFGRFEKTRSVSSGEYLVDGVFREMINDYYDAYARLLELIENR